MYEDGAEYFVMVDAQGEVLSTLVESETEALKELEELSRRRRETLWLFRTQVVSASSFVDYYEYIASSEWRARAEAAKERVGWRCQVCNVPHSKVPLDAHHRTYERLGREEPGDITVLCRECHQLFETRRGVYKDYGHSRAVESKPHSTSSPPPPPQWEDVEEESSGVAMLSAPPPPPKWEEDNTTENRAESELPLSFPKLWSQVVKRASVLDRALPALLHMAKPLLASERKLDVLFDYPLLKEKFEQLSLNDVTADILREITEEDWTVEAWVTRRYPKQ